MSTRHCHCYLPLFCLALCASSLAGAADLTIQVADIKSSQGTVNVALYASADSFLKQPLTFTAAPAVQGTTTLVLKNVPAGDYAFAIYHDANGNGQMDKNAMGMPTEDYAFSNNALGQMGPASFESARFSLPAAGATVRVSVR